MHAIKIRLLFILQESLSHLQRYDVCNVTRWFDLVQNQPAVAAVLPPLAIRVNAQILQAVRHWILSAGLFLTH